MGGVLSYESCGCGSATLWLMANELELWMGNILMLGVDNIYVLVLAYHFHNHKK